MSGNDIVSRIAVDPNVCFGQPCLRGHRIWISLIRDLIETGSTIEQVLAEYPALNNSDIVACLEH